MDDKQTVIANLKAYLNDPEIIEFHTASGEVIEISKTYSWDKILAIIMGSGYEATTGDILKRIIELLEE